MQEIVPKMVVCKCLTIEVTAESDSEADGFSRKGRVEFQIRNRKMADKGKLSFKPSILVSSYGYYYLMMLYVIDKG